MSPIAISYNGNSLQTSNIMVTDVDHMSIPSITANLYEMDHSNSSSLPYYTYPSKVIKVSGVLTGSSVSNLDSLIDTFKSYLVGNGNNLDIGYAGSTRRYIATVTNNTITRPGNLTYANFTIEFTCPNPFGQDTSSTSLVNQSGLTVATRTDTPAIGGTSPYQYLIYIVTFTALSGGTNATVSISNNATGEQVNVTRNWSAGDQLIIDSTQLLNTPGVSAPVAVNGSPVDFTGAIALLSPGSNSIGYSDSLTTRTFNYSVTNTNRYL